MAGNDSLKLLVIAQPADAAALQALLSASGTPIQILQIQTLSDLRAGLAEPDWLLVIAHASASLTPAQVLSKVSEQAPRRPVLVVATPASPEEARGWLRAGAADVIRLDHIDRLPLAVERALLAGGTGDRAEYQEMFFRNQAIQLLVDPATGDIIDANHAAAQFYGHDRAALTRMSVLQLSVEPARAAAHLTSAADGRPGAFLTQHQLASGAVRDVEIQSSPVSRTGRPMLYAIIHDVTDRIQRERELETVAKFAAVLRTAPTRAAMLPVILAQVTALVGASGAALVLRDPLTGELVVELAHGWPEASGTHLAENSLAGQVVATGQAEWRLAAQAGAQAAAPLAAQGNATGAICVSLAAAPSTLQIRLLSAMTDMTANALQRATLHEQTEQRLQRLAALHAIDLAITSSFDLRVTLGILLNHLMEQVPVGGAGILLLNVSTQSLEYAAIRGLNAALMHQSPMRLGDSLAGRVVSAGQPLRLNELGGQLPPGRRPYHVGRNRFSNYYGVPLSAKGRVQGVLEILNHGSLPADADSLEYIDSLATQAAIAIDSASMFSDLQRTNVDLNLAYDATIEGWSRVLEARGIESPGHTRRVADQTIKLAQAAGFGGIDLIHARHGALLHDIGMLAVPEAVPAETGAAHG